MNVAIEKCLKNKIFLVKFPNMHVVKNSSFRSFSLYRMAWSYWWLNGAKLTTPGAPPLIATTSFLWGAGQHNHRCWESHDHHLYSTLGWYCKISLLSSSFSCVTWTFVAVLMGQMRNWEKFLFVFNSRPGFSQTTIQK